MNTRRNTTKKQSSAVRPTFDLCLAVQLVNRSGLITIGAEAPAVNDLVYVGGLLGDRVPQNDRCHRSSDTLTGNRWSCRPPCGPGNEGRPRQAGVSEAVIGESGNQVGQIFYRNSAFNSHPVVEIDSSENPSSIYPSESFTLPAEFRGRHLSASLDIL